jgi:hypothetical protein
VSTFERIRCTTFTRIRQHAWVQSRVTVDQLEADAIRVAAAVQPVEIRDQLAQQAKPRKPAAAVPERMTKGAVLAMRRRP